MTVKCCFKSCKNDPLNVNSARCEIKSAIPSSGFDKHRGALLVAWKTNGEATFHLECWSLLLRLARKRHTGTGSRKRKSATDSRDEENMTMLQIEKAMIKEANKTVEKFDSAQDVEKYAIQVVNLIKKAKHCVFFTGAGVSTSAGLGDFRGKGGKWTEQDRDDFDLDGLWDGTQAGHADAGPEKKPRTEDESEMKNENDLTSSTASTSKDVVDDDNDEDKEEEEINYEQLRPTLTHEAISQLVHLGLVKYVISQNCDGLHLLSGVPQGKISELHGNVFLEKCEKCDKRYARGFYVCDDICDLYLEEISDFGETNIIAPKFVKKCDKCGLCHRTGRKCDGKKCKGFLMDTIINFSDNLEEGILDKAFEAADVCDLMVCLGTTLTVTPANELVDYTRNPQRIVICNRQPTEKDDLCLQRDEKGRQLGVRVYGDCDVFMKYVMIKLLGQGEFDNFENDLRAKSDNYNKLRKTPSSK